MRLVFYRGKYAVYKDGRRYSLRTSERAEADQRFRDWHKQSSVAPDTVSGIVDAYLEEKKKKPSYPGMMDAWKNVKPYFGNYRPDQITRTLCRGYIVKRHDNGISNGTIRKELGVLRQGLRWQNKNTSAVIELPPMPAPRERHLTRAEYDRLLKSCRHKHLKLFVQLAHATAGRKSAVLDLTWDRVDFDRGIIRLGKGDKRVKGRATVPMTQTVRVALLGARERASSDYVVEYAGGKVGNVAKGFREAASDAGLKGISPHTLRHTAAVWLAEAGVPMPEIAQFLGHSDSRVTERVYARFSPEYLKKAANALEVVQLNKETPPKKRKKV